MFLRVRIVAETDTTAFRVGGNIEGTITQGSPDCVGTTTGLND